MLPALITGADRPAFKIKKKYKRKGGEKVDKLRNGTN